MSIKSTISLTREQAEKQYIDNRIKKTIEELKDILKYYDNGELESCLQEIDEDNGNKFTNYNIEDKEETLDE